MLGLGLLLGLGAAAAGAGTGDAVPATRTSGTTPDDAAWSNTLNGLRVRLTAPDGTTLREKVLLPLRVEVQNNGDRPIPYNDLWPTVRFLAHDANGQWIGIPAMGPQAGDWANQPGSLAPGKTTELKVAFQSLRFNRPLKAGEVIQLQAGAPTQQQRPGKLPLEAHSPALSIRIAAPFPQALAGEEVAAPWKMDLVCQVDQGMIGNQSIRVGPDGTATLVLNTQRDGQRINKQLSVTLPAERLAELAGALHKMELWKLAQADPEIAFPDEGSVRLALVGPSAGSVAGTFPSHLESRQPVVKELRQTIEGLMGEVEALAAKQQEGRAGAAEKP